MLACMTPSCRPLSDQSDQAAALQELRQTERLGDWSGCGGKERHETQSLSKKGKSGRCEFEHRPSEKWLSISFHRPVPLPTQTHPRCVTERRARPASSFVHPGMWDILTSWLFIDGAQLRVPPVALSLSHSGVSVCLFRLHYLCYQPNRPHPERE